MSARKNNTKIYSANKQFPFIKELQSIVLKSQTFSRGGNVGQS